MWQVEEHARVEGQLEAMPLEVQRRYEKWKDIATISGLPGLRAIRGFRDEALLGQWQGCRSSRLGLKYRVIYRVVASRLMFQVLAVTPHDYRRH